MSARIERAFKNNRTPSPRLERRSGYTLAEMLVVLAIVALLAAIVVPRFAVSRKGTGLKSGATEVITALRTARRLAITGRELRALALDIYSIPAQFVVMRQRRPNEAATEPEWIQEGEFHALPNNIAIVAVETPGWTTLDVTRTDDYDLDGYDQGNPPGSTAVGNSGHLLSSGLMIFNPQTNPSTGLAGRNFIVNPIYHLIQFEPTGTADRALIYLWNVEDARRDFPSPTIPQILSNLHTLGVPPGFLIDTNDQASFFTLPDPESPEDANYYTLAVNPITGGVTAYDYAWGTGNEEDDPDFEWDRKKDGR